MEMEQMNGMEWMIHKGTDLHVSASRSLKCAARRSEWPAFAPQRVCGGDCVAAGESEIRNVTAWRR